MFHHQTVNFPPGRSLRRPSHVPRPGLFLTSSIPRYNGSSSMASPFGTLPRRPISQMSAFSLGRFPRIEPMAFPPLPQQQHQPYCTVEEIKQGKKQKRGRAKERQERGEEEENHYEEHSQDGDGDSSDGYDGLYERAPDSRPGSRDLKFQSKPLPPPLPPPLPSFAGKAMANGWKGKQHSPEGRERSGKELFKKGRRSRTKLIIVLLLFLLCALLLVLPLLLLWLSSPVQWPQMIPNFPIESRPRPKLEQSQEIVPLKELLEAREVLVEPAKLAEWMASGGSAQRVRLFEVREGKEQQQRQEERESSSSSAMAGLAQARPLQIGSLSHNGVPVHPLQFQRLLRAQGVDEDSLIVLFDRHPQGLLAAYALWIFRLYGHEASFMLNGGLANWQEFLAKNPGVKMAGEELAGERRAAGTFRAEWRSQLIATFDDLLANFEAPRADMADAQSPEEFDGKSPSSASSSSETAVIFGHIRTAVNLPVERLFLPSSPGRMPSAQDQARLFAAAGLSPRRPVIVYDGFSSLRAAALWAALQRANHTAALYFGAWPEWLIRAPDHLKIIPD